MIITIDIRFLIGLGIIAIGAFYILGMFIIDTIRQRRRRRNEKRRPK